MPLPLMIVYRVLGVLFLALAAAALWEKYRTVRGGTLLPARILGCRKADRTSPRGGAGGYRSVVAWNARPTTRSGSATTRKRAKASGCGTAPAARCWNATTSAPS